jgi:hypothetical protein
MNINKTYRYTKFLQNKNVTQKLKSQNALVNVLLHMKNRKNLVRLLKKIVHAKLHKLTKTIKVKKLRPTFTPKNKLCKYKTMEYNNTTIIRTNHRVLNNTSRIVQTPHKTIHIAIKTYNECIVASRVKTTRVYFNMCHKSSPVISHVPNKIHTHRNTKANVKTQLYNTLFNNTSGHMYNLNTIPNMYLSSIPQLATHLFIMS